MNNATPLQPIDVPFDVVGDFDPDAPFEPLVVMHQRRRERRRAYLRYLWTEAKEGAKEGAARGLAGGFGILIAVVLFLGIASCSQASAADYASRIQLGEITIHAIEHAGVVLETPQGVICIDPVSGDWTPWAGRCDLVLVTHRHPDHYNERTIALVHAGPVITAEMVPSVDARRVLDEFGVLAMPAYNTEGILWHRRGDAVGYLVFDGAGTRIYVAGDTDAIPEMRFPSRLSVTAALLPLRQPYTMGLEGALEAAAMIRPQMVIPYHFRRGDDPLDLVAPLAAMGISTVMLEWYP